MTFNCQFQFKSDRTHKRISFLLICSTTKAVQGIFTVATFISYGLQCYVPVEIIWGNYLSKRFNGQLKWEFAVRITIVLITCKSRRRAVILIYPNMYILDSNAIHRTLSFP